MAIHPSIPEIKVSANSNTPQQDLSLHSNFYASLIKLLLQRQINGQTDFWPVFTLTDNVTQSSTMHGRHRSSHWGCHRIR